MALAISLETRVSPSLLAYTKTAGKIADSFRRIYTGERIVRSGDDGSDLTSALRLQTQTSTLRSTLTSGARATSFLQIASGGLSQIRALLDTLSGLTSEANTPGQTKLSYATLSAQFQSTLTQIDTVVANTTFNGTSLLDGSANTSLDPYFQFGATSGDTVSLALPDVSVSGLFTTTPNLHNAVSATAATTSVATAGDTVNKAIALVDAYQLRLTLADAAARQEIASLTTGIRGLTATDTGAEMRDANARLLRQNTAAAVLAQTLGFNSQLLNLLG